MLTLRIVVPMRHCTASRGLFKMMSHVEKIGEFSPVVNKCTAALPARQNAWISPVAICSLRGIRESKLRNSIFRFCHCASRSPSPNLVFEDRYQLRAAWTNASTFRQDNVPYCRTDTFSRSLEHKPSLSIIGLRIRCRCHF